MKNINVAEEKIIPFDKIEGWVKGLRLTAKTIVFTNGCFDILHEGHIYSLSQAAKEADCLIVGVNADSSVKKLKGENRPVPVFSRDSCDFRRADCDVRTVNRRQLDDVDVGHA